MATSQLELLFQAVKTRLEAIKGDATYNYGNTLVGVERQILEQDGEQFSVNAIGDTPKIIILRGANTPAGGDDVATFARQQTFQILFKLADKTNCEDVGKAIEDMVRALFATDWTGNSRLHEWTVDITDPESQVLLPGPQLSFSITYNEKIGDPTSG
jgi:hypothetical protein